MKAPVLATPTFISIPKLKDLISDPAVVNDLPAEAVAGLLGELEELRARLWRRNNVVIGETERLPELDRLVSVPEAAAILGKTPDDIYRHDYPFKVKDRRGVKCSWQGLQEYIRQLRRAR